MESYKNELFKSQSDARKAVRIACCPLRSYGNPVWCHENAVRNGRSLYSAKKDGIRQ